MLTRRAVPSAGRMPYALEQELSIIYHPARLKHHDDQGPGRPTKFILVQGEGPCTFGLLALSLAEYTPARNARAVLTIPLNVCYTSARLVG